METSIVFPFDKDIVDTRDTTGIHPFSIYNSSTSRRREVWGIVAMGLGNEIGEEGDMPWHLPVDLRHFKDVTMGHPIVMGRATWQSLPRKPLPGRVNIVLTRQSGYEAPGAELAGTLAEALSMAPPPEVPIVIGGGQIYAEAMPLLTRIYVTRIESHFEGADTFFPEIDPTVWRMVEESEILLSKSGLNYRFERYDRHEP